MRFPGVILVAVLVSGCASINPPELNYVGTISMDCKSLTNKQGKVIQPKHFKISPLEAINLAYSAANKTCSQEFLDALYADAKYYYVYKFKSQAESLSGPSSRDILTNSIVVSGATGEVVRK
jgi:hypothetical protein